MKRVLATGAMLLVLAVGQQAEAAPKGSLLALGLEASGLPASLVASLDAAMRAEADEVTGRRVKLLPKPAIDFEGMRLAAGCADDGPECLTTIARTMGATQLLRARLVGDPTRARVELTVLEVGSGKAQTTTGELTEIDADSALELRILVAQAFGVKKDAPPGSIALSLAGGSATLAGAELMLDDRGVEASALKRVSAGAHRLEVRQEGFETFLWRGAVRPGRETRVEVAFQPKAPLGVALTGAGAATPEIGSGSELEAPPTTVDASAERAGPNLVLPVILGGVAAAAILFGSIEFGLMKSAESSLAEDCRLPENAARCAPTPGAGETVCDGANPLDQCADGERAATLATISFVSAGVLAAGAATFLYLELAADRSTPTYGGSVVPTANGASLSAYLHF
ncbi:MAG: hypothetical protein IT384_32825 [Deltaproteobacteria bacterium]|nr:hypothetical protein [Deltaproteobacteria bacterium]